MKLSTSALLPCVLGFASGVYAQTTHTVTVGLLGSFFDPPTLSAGLNDTVVFQFAGPVHTVTQTLFNTPCVALPGGFNSGAAGTKVMNTTSSWSLKITNVSEPIWYFCQISTPVSHCASGMVGAINPPSQEMFQQFRSAAEAVSGTPSPIVSVALTGIGAVATGSPSVISSSSIPSSTASTTSSVSTSTTSSASASSSTTSATQAPSTSKNHLGGIIGGVIGGLVGALLILGALLWCLRQRKLKARRESASTDDSRFFRYHVPVRTPSDAFRAAKANENSNFSNSTDSPRAVRNANLATRDSSPDLSRPLSPVRRGQFEPINLAMPTEAAAVNPPTTDNAQPANMNAGATPSGGQVSNFDMQTLANEVAQVLIRSTSGNTLNAQRRAAMEDPAGNYHPRSMHIENPSADGHGLLDPPAYRQQAGVNSPVTLKSRLPRD